VDLSNVPGFLKACYCAVVAAMIALGVLFALTKIFPGGRPYSPAPVAVCQGRPTVIPATYGRGDDGQVDTTNVLNPRTIVCPNGRVYEP